MDNLAFDIRACHLANRLAAPPRKSSQMIQQFTDTSRDPRIEDPTNLWVIDRLAERLVPVFLRFGISANATSILGLIVGCGAALAYRHWAEPAWVVLALALCFIWLVADSMDGMIARATQTSSAFGRQLDGLCDHGVFIMIYVCLAGSFGTAQAWSLATCAGMAHALQANFYGAERGRFHRRLGGDPGLATHLRSHSPLIRFYDAIASSLDRFTRPFDQWLATSADRRQAGAKYSQAAVSALRWMLPLTANMRVIAIGLACLAGSPKLFWWYELLPLSLVAISGTTWLRRIEREILTNASHEAAGARRS